jgi:hypothetical protein
MTSWWYCCEKRKTKLVGHYLLGSFYLWAMYDLLISLPYQMSVVLVLGVSVPPLSIYQSYQHMGSISQQVHLYGHPSCYRCLKIEKPPSKLSLSSQTGTTSRTGVGARYSALPISRCTCSSLSHSTSGCCKTTSNRPGSCRRR